MSIFRTIALFVYLFGYMIVHYSVLCKAERALAAGDTETVRQLVKKHIPHWSKGILNVTGVRLSVEGLDNIPKDGPCVFVANHRSYYDIPLLLAGLDEPYGILAKEELGKIPLLNRWMKLLGCVFVQRDDVRASVRALNDATAIVESGRSFIIFPEGTRYKGEEGGAGEFKAGAFRIAVKTGAPVVPVAISGARGLFEAHGKPGYTRHGIRPGAAAHPDCRHEQGRAEAAAGRCASGHSGTAVNQNLEGTAPWQATVTNAISTPKTSSPANSASTPARNAGPTGGIITSSGSSSSASSWCSSATTSSGSISLPSMQTITWPLWPPTTCPEATQTALQDALAAYGEDRNGDGKVVVKLNLYTMDFGNEDSDAYLDMAGTTKLSTDIQGALSSIFILYDPAGFQQTTGTLRYLDGSLPQSDADSDWWNMVYRWTDCPVLAGLDLGDYASDAVQSESGSSQELMSRYYIGIRGAWNKDSADLLEGGEELWNKLTAGAVSTASAEG